MSSDLTSSGGISQTAGDARYLKLDGTAAGASSQAQTLTNGVTLGTINAVTGLIKFFLSGSLRALSLSVSGMAVANRTLFFDASGMTSGNATWKIPAASGSVFLGVPLRVGTQFDATTTTLTAVTGLTAALAASTSYEFEAVLHVTADAVGGHKYAIDTSDTLTASAIVYQVNSINNGTNAFRINSRQTALGGAVGEAVGTAYFTVIRGLITANAAGTFAVQFAQNAANGTSSVLVGSSLTIWPVL